MKKVREVRKEKAKDNKDANRLVRENIQLLKSKIQEQNKQLNQVVKYNKIIARDSIEFNKENKYKMLMDIKKAEVIKAKQHVELKENELMFWKNQYQNIIFN